MDAFYAEHVKSALDELNVIYEFDVVSYDDISSIDLRNHIDRVGVEIYPAFKERDYEKAASS